MLIGVVAFAAYTFYTKPSTPESVYYEADSSGRLRRVQKPSVVAVPLPPLWKPEPDLLLRHSSRLNLSAAQMAILQKVSDAWTAEKQKLEQLIQTASKPAISNKRTTQKELQRSLLEYSQLSKNYDLRRSYFWRQATACLTAEQKSTLTILRKTMK